MLKSYKDGFKPFPMGSQVPWITMFGRLDPNGETLPPGEFPALTSGVFGADWKNQISAMARKMDGTFACVQTFRTAKSSGSDGPPGGVGPMGLHVLPGNTEAIDARLLVERVCMEFESAWTARRVFHALVRREDGKDDSLGPWEELPPPHRGNMYIRRARPDTKDSVRESEADD